MKNRDVSKISNAAALVGILNRADSKKQFPIRGFAREGCLAEGGKPFPGGSISGWLISAALLAVWCCTAMKVRGQSRIYYSDDYHPASMAVNGTDKRIATGGEPSYFLHGGQRWFLQLRSVAGTRPDGRDRYEVFAVSQDETSAVQLSDDPNFAPNDVRWLKNDGAISYSGVHFHSGPLDGDSHILRLAISEVGGVLGPAGLATVVATAGVTELSGTYLQSDIFSHDWAPGGAELVFDDRPGYNAGFTDSLIRRVNVTTGAVSLIIDNGTTPVYAPNGTEIAFRRGGYRITPGIYAIHPDGSGLRIIVKDSQTTASYEPSWSPNGASLAFNRQTLIKPGYTNYTWDVFSCPSAGGNGAKVTNLTGDTANYVSLTGWR